MANKLNTKGLGFFFCIGDGVLALLLLIMSLLPASVSIEHEVNLNGTKATTTIQQPCWTMDGNVTSPTFTFAFFSLLATVVWIILQGKGLCRWSMAEFGETLRVEATADAVVIEACRCFWPRWGITIFVGIVLGLGCSIGTAIRTANYRCVDPQKLVIVSSTPSGVWAACAVFSFVASFVYIGETAVIFLRTRNYDGV